MKRIPCKVFAPASVANIAVGYDILGFAIEGLGDEVIIKEGKEPGVVIEAIHGNRSLSKDLDKNTAGFAARSVLRALNLEQEPLSIVLKKNLSIGTGLGSSASSSVAGAYAVNAYFNFPLSKKELLYHATLGEQIADGAFHADNVAPSLLGGIILIRDNESLDYVKLPAISGLKVLVIYPHIKILTENARAILSEDISLESHIKQSGNLAAFVAALYKSDLPLLQRCLEDVIIEPQRAQLIPEFHSIKEIAKMEGCLGFSISGAGPSMFALCPNSVVAENIRDKVKQHLDAKKLETSFYLTKIDLEGAIKY